MDFENMQNYFIKQHCIYFQQLGLVWKITKRVKMFENKKK